MAPAAEMWPLEKLYSRPFVWGTPPDAIKWSRTGHVLFFLWNAEGYRFRDLYAYHADSKKLVRLTRLEQFQDELLKSSAERDQRRKKYLAPQGGLGGYTISNDGSRAAFSFKGELFTVRADGSGEPVRITRTKSPEADPELSPDGQRLAAIENGQVVVHHLSDGRIWQITDVPDAADLTAFRFSRDGRKVTYLLNLGKERQQVLPNYSGRFVAAPQFSRSVAGDDPVEVALEVVSAEGGKPIRADLGDWGGKIYGADSPIWSPDSKKLLLRSVSRDMKKSEPSCRRSPAMTSFSLRISSISEKSSKATRSPAP